MQTVVLNTQVQLQLNDLHYQIQQTYARIHPWTKSAHWHTKIYYRRIKNLGHYIQKMLIKKNEQERKNHYMRIKIS